jgi:hypothetical protein
MKPYFLELTKYETIDDTPVLTYLIFVSKKFNAKTPNALIANPYGYSYNIIRNELCFYPQFHYLEKMDGNTIDSYTATQCEAICCAVEINNGNRTIPFRYGRQITGAEWTFYNNLTNDTLYHPGTSNQPFVANSDNVLLSPGYYDVSFKYSLSDGVTNEYRLDSAFRIK